MKTPDEQNRFGKVPGLWVLLGSVWWGGQPLFFAGGVLGLDDG